MPAQQPLHAQSGSGPASCIDAAGGRCYDNPVTHHLRLAAAALAAAVLTPGLVFTLACGGPSSPAGDKPAVNASYNKKTGKLELLTFDTNKDGKTDVWNYMDGTRLVRSEIDTNFDGIIDRWEYYAGDGSLEKVGFSREKDGKVDAWAFKGADGQVTRIEISTRRDGQVSRWEFYEKGAMVRAEEDTTGSGKPDKWETYRGGSLASVALDTQKRGRPDRRLVNGPKGVTVETLK